MLYIEYHPFPHVRHRMAGRPTVQDIVLALEHTQQHNDVPVLWDLRKLDGDEDMWIYAANLASTVVNSRVSQMTSEKRAFVVANDFDHAGIEMVLGRLTVPWPSAVFRGIDEALRWLES